ncbi:hypothetical protein B0H14DRAFT_2576146 [Mycena olivaceomarginata]|nr:hypothetical protein B0H14DRAFT_2576146 [Mycena olivaceomarginata]
MPRDISYAADRQTTLAPTLCGKASRRRHNGARDAGDTGTEIRGSSHLAEMTSANPRPTSTDIGQLPLGQPGLAPSANLGQPQPTSINSAEGPSKCSDCCMNVPLLYGEGLLVGLDVVEDT